MKKNSQLHLFLETQTLNNLKKQASEDNVSVSELCRQKIREEPRLTRIELILERLLKRKY